VRFSIWKTVIPGAIICFFAAFAKAGDVAYFYALDADLAALQSAGSLVGAPKSVAGQRVTTVRIGTHSVRAVKMGSGGIPTAVAAATLLARFPCDLAVSTGPAGRLSDELAVGEWVRVAEVVSYQQGSETNVGFALSPNATRKLDGKLGKEAPTSLRECKPVRLASGELFIASGLFREQLRATTNALCVDMNLAGLTIACAEAKVPLFAWKVISDSANDSAPADFQAFVKTYKGEGGKRIADFLKTLPLDPSDPNAHSNLQSLLNSAEGPARDIQPQKGERP
jgi:nucleoside phosphorylase